MSKMKHLGANEDVQVIEGDFAELEDGDVAEDNELNAYISQRIAELAAEQEAKINEMFGPVNKQLDDHSRRIQNLEKVVHNLVDAPASKVAPVSKEEQGSGLDRILDATFGTAGRALHAIVDATAYVVESAIDIVTLGRARRTNH